jgi:hypothetical protein
MAATACADMMSAPAPPRVTPTFGEAGLLISAVETVSSRPTSPGHRRARVALVSTYDLDEAASRTGIGAPEPKQRVALGIVTFAEVAHRTGEPVEQLMFLRKG